MSATAEPDEACLRARRRSLMPTTSGAEGEGTPAASGAQEDPEKDNSARHLLRRRTVAWFKQNPNAPGGAIPKAVMHVVGGPMMWSEHPVRANQFSPEQKDLLFRAYREIKQLHAAAGGERQRRVRYQEGLGLMPESSSKWPYQSEEWAAERALNTGPAGRSIPVGLSPAQRLDAEVSEAYYVVTTWMDYVKGGLLDASAIYEYEDDEPD